MAAEGAVRADPLRKALTHGLAIWAIVAPIWVLLGAALHHRFALDFHYSYLPAAHAVLHGLSPYSGADSAAALSHEAFLYPPLTAYLLAPFTVLPPVVAEVVAVLLVAGTVPAVLLLLGVRDWRCHAIAFLWWPVIIGVQSANATLLLILGLALGWRYRDRPLVAGVAAAFAVAIKAFFCPVLIWLVATRRYRAAALGALGSLALVVLPWAGLDFAGMRGYPHLLLSASRYEGPRSYSIAALLHGVLPSWSAATGVETALGLGVLVIAVLAGRRGRDRDAFAAALIGTLVLSPLLEMHYLAVLLLVVALYQRRFSLAWVAPLLIFGAPSTVATSEIQVVHILVVAAATVALAVTDWTPSLVGRDGR
jgi:hypothetical protein